MKRELLDTLMRARADKVPAAVLTWLSTGTQRVVVAGEPLESPLDAAFAAALARDRSTTVMSTADGEVFVHVFNPPLRLCVVGAVHITQSLVPMAVLLGYEATVVDPRRSFATSERFPGATLDWDWPDEAMQRLEPDARTAVITLTHDPKLDDPALHVALRTPAFYIGCLGSQRTHQARLTRLREAGFADQDLSRLHGPIGLDLGGRSPAEIALAAVAQMTATLRGGRVA